MKNDQKNKTNPSMPSTYLSHASNTTNMEPSPPDRPSDNGLKPRKYSQIFSRTISYR